jgi:prepilin-type N-terminal cleavage/methylation domain-containing protein
MNQSKAGYTLIESLVAIGLIAILVPAAAFMFSFVSTVTAQADKFTRAHALSQEGMEAVMYLKNKQDSAWDWTNTPANTSGSSVYQPNLVAGVWELGTQTPTPVIDLDPFTRTLTIEPVFRNLSLQLSDSGTPDPFARLITITVSWLDKGQVESVVKKTYVSFH